MRTFRIVTATTIGEGVQWTEPGHGIDWLHVRDGVAERMFAATVEELERWLEDAGLGARVEWVERSES